MVAFRCPNNIKHNTDFVKVVVRSKKFNICDYLETNIAARLCANEKLTFEVNE